MIKHEAKLYLEVSKEIDLFGLLHFKSYPTYIVFGDIISLNKIYVG